MSRNHRRRVPIAALDLLEPRQLLAAAQVAGNAGQLIRAQFQPYGFRSTVGTQLQGVTLGGPLLVDVVGATDAGASPFRPVVNTGLVGRTQFNGGGFETVGLQFRRVRVGGGLSVTGFDNEFPASSSTVPVLHLLENRNVISNSQFNDGGFGTIEADAAGRLVSREGRVGLQWRRVRVGGAVSVQVDDEIIQPGASAPAPVAASSGTARVSALGVSDAGQTVIDFSTNSGRIVRSQFNDGGFGDIGMQWSHVKVGGRVGTTTNTLFLKPQQNNLGPITIADRTFGGRRGGLTAKAIGASPTGEPSASGERVGGLTASASSSFRTTYTNSATNSGRIVDSQFNDGGFGDVGLQWRNVRIGGDVTAAHNSLTVQPENKGQGLITIRNVRFPVDPSVQPAPGPRQRLATNPPVILEDGDPVSDLPRPTGPVSPFFPTPFGGSGTVTLPFPGNYPLVNAATNSGLIRSGQFNAGGFGDQGLQWRDVRVKGHVRLVHNSLSVHPEGSQLAGISVSDVSYGAPLGPKFTRRLAVLPYAVISPGPLDGSASRRPARTASSEVLRPPNDRILTNQQLASASGTDVFLQWNGIEHRRGLVIVHNIIKISGVGPQTGPITLSNIRFPFRVPTIGVLDPGRLRPSVSMRPSLGASTGGDDPIRGRLLNSANNSGVVDHAQFNSGGFGDQGLQWRRVSVEGSVDVVHNTLSVDASADLPPGDVSGPISISGVTFNSGALAGALSRKANHVIVSPPDVFQRVSSRKVNTGKALAKAPGVRDETINSGILAGGQIAAGGASHALLQWQCVRARGKVRVMDNVLSISVQDRPSGPITISDVTFA